MLGARCICAGGPPRCSAWELVNPSPQANHLRDVAHGGGRWVAVGEGVAVTSTDGSTWSAAPLPGASLRGVAYGNGRFVAVGAGGVILRFANGVTWESAEPPTTSDLAAVAFAGGQFLAVGADTTVLSSSDGLAWTSEHPVELQGDLLGVRESGAFNGNPGPMFLEWSSAAIALRRLDGTWVAIAVPPGAAVARSVDGAAWAPEAFRAIPARLLAVAGGRRVQLAVGEAGLTLRRECHPQSPTRRLRRAR